MIWHTRPTAEALNALHRETAPGHLGLEFIEIGDDYLTGRVPIDARTRQPYGVLHGGVSVVLAETLGSMAAACCVDAETTRVVGQEVNANHLRPVAEGWVTGTARPFHLGRRSQVWSIELRDDAGKLTCIARLTVAVVPIEW